MSSPDMQELNLAKGAQVSTAEEVKAAMDRDRPSPGFRHPTGKEAVDQSRTGKLLYVVQDSEKVQFKHISNAINVRQWCIPEGDNLPLAPGGLQCRPVGFFNPGQSTGEELLKRIYVVKAENLTSSCKHFASMDSGLPLAEIEKKTTYFVVEGRECLQTITVFNLINGEDDVQVSEFVPANTTTEDMDLTTLPFSPYELQLLSQEQQGVTSWAKKKSPFDMLTQLSHHYHRAAQLHSSPSMQSLVNRSPMMSDVPYERNDSRPWQGRLGVQGDETNNLLLLNVHCGLFNENHSVFKTERFKKAHEDGNLCFRDAPYKLLTDDEKEKVADFERHLLAESGIHPVLEYHKENLRKLMNGLDQCPLTQAILSSCYSEMDSGVRSQNAFLSLEQLICPHGFTSMVGDCEKAIYLCFAIKYIEDFLQGKAENVTKQVLKSMADAVRTGCAYVSASYRVANDLLSEKEKTTEVTDLQGKGDVLRLKVTSSEYKMIPCDLLEVFGAKGIGILTGLSADDVHQQLVDQRNYDKWIEPRNKRSEHFSLRWFHVAVMKPMFMSAGKRNLPVERLLTDHDYLPDSCRDSVSAMNSKKKKAGRPRKKKKPPARRVLNAAVTKSGGPGPHNPDVPETPTEKAAREDLQRESNRLQKEKNDRNQAVAAVKRGARGRTLSQAEKAQIDALTNKESLEPIDKEDAISGEEDGEEGKNHLYRNAPGVLGMVIRDPMLYLSANSIDTDGIELAAVQRVERDEKILGTLTPEEYLNQHPKMKDNPFFRAGKAQYLFDRGDKTGGEDNLKGILDALHGDGNGKASISAPELLEGVSEFLEINHGKYPGFLGEVEKDPMKYLELIKADLTGEQSLMAHRLVGRKQLMICSHTPYTFFEANPELRHSQMGRAAIAQFAIWVGEKTGGPDNMRGYASNASGQSGGQIEVPQVAQEAGPSGKTGNSSGDVTISDEVGSSKTGHANSGTAVRSQAQVGDGNASTSAIADDENSGDKVAMPPPTTGDSVVPGSVPGADVGELGSGSTPQNPSDVKQSKAVAMEAELSRSVASKAKGSVDGDGDVVMGDLTVEAEKVKCAQGADKAADAAQILVEKDVLDTTPDVAAAVAGKSPTGHSATDQGDSADKQTTVTLVTESTEKAADAGKQILDEAKVGEDSGVDSAAKKNTGDDRHDAPEEAVGDKEGAEKGAEKAAAAAAASAAGKGVEETASAKISEGKSGPQPMVVERSEKETAGKTDTAGPGIGDIDMPDAGVESSLELAPDLIQSLALQSQSPQESTENVLLRVLQHVMHEKEKSPESQEWENAKSLIENAVRQTLEDSSWVLSPMIATFFGGDVAQCANQLLAVFRNAAETVYLSGPGGPSPACARSMTNPWNAVSGANPFFANSLHSVVHGHYSLATCAAISCRSAYEVGAFEHYMLRSKYVGKFDRTNKREFDRNFKKCDKDKSLFAWFLSFTYLIRGCYKGRVRNLVGRKFSTMVPKKKGGSEQASDGCQSFELRPWQSLEELTEAEELASEYCMEFYYGQERVVAVPDSLCVEAEYMVSQGWDLEKDGLQYEEPSDSVDRGLVWSQTVTVRDGKVYVKGVDLYTRERTSALAGEDGYIQLGGETWTPTGKKFCAESVEICLLEMSRDKPGILSTPSGAGWNFENQQCSDFLSFLGDHTRKERFHVQGLKMGVAYLFRSCIKGVSSGQFRSRPTGTGLLGYMEYNAVFGSDAALKKTVGEKKWKRVLNDKSLVVKTDMSVLMPVKTVQNVLRVARRDREIRSLVYRVNDEKVQWGPEELLFADSAKRQSVARVQPLAGKLCLPKEERKRREAAEKGKKATGAARSGSDSEERTSEVISAVLFLPFVPKPYANMNMNEGAHGKKLLHLRGWESSKFSTQWMNALEFVPDDVQKWHEAAFGHVAKKDLCATERCHLGWRLGMQMLGPRLRWDLRYRS